MAMSMTSKKVFFAVCASLLIMSEGNAFLKAAPKHSHHTVSVEDVQASLLAEVEGTLGTGIGSKRITEIKALLTPMFAAVPKNIHGNVEHVTMRYMLHRVFVQRHGWSIAGLEGVSKNSSTSAGILKDQVPDYIENMFEERLGGKGLGLQELAVFAATIEHLIHNEAVGRLGSALSVHKLLPTASMTKSQADAILDTYMMAHILGEDLSNSTLEHAQEMIRDMPEVFLAWGDTQKFVRKIRQQLTPQSEQELSFAVLAKVAETVGEQFGKFQDAECLGLKAALVKLEDRGSGRVRLSDFYKPAVAGESTAWQFQESVAYLRQLGALDESNKDEPRVMIPNYLTSQANCIASSDYYSVCCLNECEDLMGHLEKDIAAPEAPANRIASLINALPSSSVSAPRELSQTLRNRLDAIGAQHDGMVQLHGRLFAQWMHHAYPRECPFPHMSGTTIQEKAEDWGELSVASAEEMNQFTAVPVPAMATQSETIEDMHDLMMWSHEEELLVVRPALAPPAANAGFAGPVRNVALFSALASVVFGIVRAVLPSAGDSKMQEKFMV